MRNWMRRIVAVGTGMVVAAGLLVSPLATLGLCVLVTVCVVAVVLCSANEDGDAEAAGVVTEANAAWTYPEDDAVCAAPQACDGTLTARVLELYLENLERVGLGVEASGLRSHIAALEARARNLEAELAFAGVSYLVPDVRSASHLSPFTSHLAPAEPEANP
jgi:hypothetical protein